MDRASGSGVFARDPDALLDLIELELTDALLKQQKDSAVCDACMRFLNDRFEDWEDDVSQDDLCSRTQIEAYCKKKLSAGQYGALQAVIHAAEKRVQEMTAWRIEGTLREFPKFAPVNLWFDYPVHRSDNVEVLSDIQPEAEKPAWQKAAERRKSPEQKKKERKQSVQSAFEACGIDDEITVQAMAEYMGISEKTVRNRIKEHGGFLVEEGKVRKKT